MEVYVIYPHFVEILWKSRGFPVLSFFGTAPNQPELRNPPCLHPFSAFRQLRIIGGFLCEPAALYTCKTDVFHI